MKRSWPSWKTWYDYFRENSEVEHGSLKESEAGAMLKTKFRRYRKKVMAEIEERMREEADRRVLEIEVVAERRLQEEKAEAARRLHEMVRAMKTRGMENSVIQEITGLPAREIEGIQAEQYPDGIIPKKMHEQNK